MSAGLKENDDMFSVREKPWHGMGVVLDEPPKDAQDALKKAGLNWTVEQVPVEMQKLDNADRVQIPGYFANVRSDTGEALGIVSSKYKVRQNDEAFSFLSNILGSELHFETAGSLSNGRRVWVMARIPDHIEVGGDAVEVFTMITNSHDGYRATKAAVTPIRVVCQNTLTWALAEAQRIYSIAHLGSLEERVMEARNVLDLTVNYAKQFKQFGDQLATEKFTERQLQNVLGKLYPTNGPGMTDRKVENVETSKAHIVHLFKEGKTVGNAPGTKWSALNAISEFVDYGAKTDHDGKLIRAVDDPTGLKKKAQQLIAA